jgi:hypothetical protein
MGELGAALVLPTGIGVEREIRQKNAGLGTPYPGRSRRGAVHAHQRLPAACPGLPPRCPPLRIRYKRWPRRAAPPAAGGDRAGFIIDSAEPLNGRIGLGPDGQEGGIQGPEGGG